MIRRWSHSGLVALVTLVALAACGGTHDAPTGGPQRAGSGAAAPGPPGSAPAASPARACVAARPAESPTAGPSRPPADGSALPDLALACLVDGAQVRLARLGRPAVVNLWASWCKPCRTELPAFEAYARRAGGALLVLGVATDDDRAAAQSVVEDLGLTFPMLYDRDRRLLLAVDRVNLPVTLFVDAHGRLAHVYNSTALDTAGIARLAGQYLGVVVRA